MPLFSKDELEQTIKPMLETLQSDKRPTAAKEVTDTLINTIVQDRQLVRDQIKSRARATLPQPIDIHAKYEGEQHGDMSRYQLDIENNPQDVEMMLKMTEDMGFSNAAMQARKAVDQL